MATLIRLGLDFRNLSDIERVNYLPFKYYLNCYRYVQAIKKNIYIY